MKYFLRFLGLVGLSIFAASLSGEVEALSCLKCKGKAQCEKSKEVGSCDDKTENDFPETSTANFSFCYTWKHSLSLKDMRARMKTWVIKRGCGGFGNVTGCNKDNFCTCDKDGCNKDNGSPSTPLLSNLLLATAFFCSILGYREVLG